MTRVLVTGASGFVGHHLCCSLASAGFDVTGTSRSEIRGRPPECYELRMVGDMGAPIDWSPVLRNIDFVVHLAARVHVMQDRERDALAAFRQVNVRGTEQLLCHESIHKVKRFVFVSSVKVHGDETDESPFAASDVLSPADPYAQSKCEAEELVSAVGRQTELETVIVRPPLVYGPAVGGNFLRLLRLVDKGYPLPFGRIRNQRSMVGVENLCDLIQECLTNPSAPGRRFLVSDNSDVSTPGLIELIANAMEKPVRLLPVPTSILTGVARALGRSAELSRLTGSLQVDIGDTMEALGWTPPVSMADGIRSTAKWYKQQKDNA